ncbi:MAG: pyrroline-5-carboxylate reductase [Planctomycetota bacterium]
MTTFDRPLTVIGGGAMAEAIVLGAQRSGVLAGPVCVADPDEQRRAVFERAVSSASAAIEWLDAQPGDGVVMLAVKPQMLEAVAREIGDRIGDRLVVSILAGMTSSRLRVAMGGSCRVVRVMPNTPALISRGTSAVSVSAHANADDGDAVTALFRGVGDVVVHLDESLMDGFTGVAGSGPAYVFYLAEAMERAAAHVGLPKDQVRAIVAETIAGAAELLRTADRSPTTLRARVTSKGGTTAAATGVFDDAGLSDVIVRAVTAARDRGRQLGT